MNNMISIKEFRERLPEVQAAWLLMDRDHQRYGCSAHPFYWEDKYVAHLHLRNKNLECYFGVNWVEVRVRSGKSDYIALEVHYRDFDGGLPIDLHASLLKHAAIQHRGKKALMDHKRSIEWCWKGLIDAASKVPEPEDIEAIYNYDE
jgi:hypothetical protein